MEPPAPASTFIWSAMASAAAPEGEWGGHWRWVGSSLCRVPTFGTGRGGRWVGVAGITLEGVASTPAATLRMSSVFFAGVRSGERAARGRLRTGGRLGLTCNPCEGV
eukprot:148565-Chlamydomonas_euryale.AAC.1